MELFIKIPTYDAITELWSHTEFTTREDFVQFLRSIFKEPGKYEFDQTSLLFNSQAKQFNSYKFYCGAPIRSRDFIQYWDFEKEKCRMGVIFKNKENTWYLTRDYYMWLNFLPIYNKEIARFGFADVRDAQYHMALYEDIAKTNEIYYGSSGVGSYGHYSSSIIANNNVNIDITVKGNSDVKEFEGSSVKLILTKP